MPSVGNKGPHEVNFLKGKVIKQSYIPMID